MPSLEFLLPVFCSLLTIVNQMDFYERIVFDCQDLFWAFLSGIHTNTRMAEVINTGKLLFTAQKELMKPIYAFKKPMGSSSCG